MYTHPRILLLITIIAACNITLCNDEKLEKQSHDRNIAELIEDTITSNDNKPIMQLLLSIPAVSAATGDPLPLVYAIFTGIILEARDNAKKEMEERLSKLPQDDNTKRLTGLLQAEHHLGTSLYILQTLKERNTQS